MEIDSTRELERIDPLEPEDLEADEPIDRFAMLVDTAVQQSEMMNEDEHEGVTRAVMMEHNDDEEVTEHDTETDDNDRSVSQQVLAKVPSFVSILLFLKLY